MIDIAVFVVQVGGSSSPIWNSQYRRSWCFGSLALGPEPLHGGEEHQLDLGLFGRGIHARVIGLHLARSHEQQRERTQRIPHLSLAHFGRNCSDVVSFSNLSVQVVISARLTNIRNYNTKD